MAIQTTSQHSTIRTSYQKSYIEGALAERLYDNFAGVVQDTVEGKGSSVTVVASTDLVPRPTAAVGSETSDFVPQTIGEVTATVTLQYLNDGLKAHELSALESTFALDTEYTKKVGMLATETIDAVARRYATEGSIVFYPGAHTTRVTLDLGASTDRMGIALFSKMAAFVDEWNIEKFADGSLMCVMTPWQFQDLLTESGSALLTRMGYTESGKDALFRNEVAALSNIRIVKSRLAKAFYGAGVANASAVATTLNGAIDAGAKTCVVTANTNIAVGMWLTLGTAQTSTETDATLIAEPVYVTGVSTTTITFTGRHELGGCRYAHATLAAVSNADTVHAAVFGGQNSLAKVFNKQLKEFGTLVGPKVDGMADQWKSVAFKACLGYNRISEGRLARAETSSSLM